MKFKIIFRINYDFKNKINTLYYFNNTKYSSTSNSRKKLEYLQKYCKMPKIEINSLINSGFW